MTPRILRAVRHPLVHTLNHPHGRLLGSRPAYAVDMPAVIEAAAAAGCALEVSADPARMDLDGGWARRVKAAGGVCTVSSDAHSTLDFDNIWLGIGSARRGWLEARDVLNTRPLEEFRALLRQRSQNGPRCALTKSVCESYGWRSARRTAWPPPPAARPTAPRRRLRQHRRSYRPSAPRGAPPVCPPSSGQRGANLDAATAPPRADPASPAGQRRSHLERVEDGRCAAATTLVRRRRQPRQASYHAREYSSSVALPTRSGRHQPGRHGHACLWPRRRDRRRPIQIRST